MPEHRGGSGGGSSSGAGGGRGSGGGGGGGSSSSAPGANGGPASNGGGGGGTGKPGTLKPDGSMVHEDLADSTFCKAEEKRKLMPPPLDYRQYFPILLPITHPETQQFEGDDKLRMAPPVPTDLAYHKVGACTCFCLCVGVLLHVKILQPPEL